MFKTSWLNLQQVQMNSKHQNMNGIFSDLGRMGQIPSEFFERTFFEGDLTGRITHLPRSRSRCTPGSLASRHQTHRWKSVCTCGDFGKHPPKSHIPHVLPPRDLRTGFKKKINIAPCCFPTFKSSNISRLWTKKYRYLYLDSLDLETSPCPHLNAKALWETVPFK